MDLSNLSEEEQAERRRILREAQSEKIVDALREQLKENPIEITEAYYKWWMKKFLHCECVHQFEPVDFVDWNEDPKCLHCEKHHSFIKATELVCFIPVETDRLLYTAIRG